MAVQDIEKLILDGQPVELAGKFLVAKTHLSGYAKVSSGDHVFKVEADKGFKVLPMLKDIDKETEEEKIVVGEDPIIIADTDANVVLVSADFSHPYNAPYTATGELKDTDDASLAVLGAFREFAQNAFTMGGFIRDTETVLRYPDMVVDTDTEQAILLVDKEDIPEDETATEVPEEPVVDPEPTDPEAGV